MLNIAICDDDRLILDNIEYEIKNIRECKVTKFIDGNNIINSDIKFDIVFLDIAMPQISGFKVAEMLKNKNSDSVIIFLTSCGDKVFEGYKYGAFRFILKDRLKEDLKEAMESAVRLFENKSSVVEFKIKNQDIISEILINTKDIICIEKILRSFILHTKDRNYRVLSGSINDIMDKLNNNFAVVHRSYIVNMDNIKRIENMDIIMCDNTVVNIGSKKQQLESFKRQYFDFMRR